MPVTVFAVSLGLLAWIISYIEICIKGTLRSSDLSLHVEGMCYVGKHTALTTAMCKFLQHLMSYHAMCSLVIGRTCSWLNFVCHVLSLRMWRTTSRSHRNYMQGGQKGEFIVDLHFCLHSKCLKSCLHTILFAQYVRVQGAVSLSWMCWGEKCDVFIVFYLSVQRSWKHGIS